METLISWFIDWAGWVFGAVATMVALRASIKFDVNQWLNDRRERKKQEVAALCTHARLVQKCGKHVFQSTYVSPPGTHAFQCQRCGDATHDRGHVDQSLEYWANNPEKFFEREKELDKRMRKIFSLK